MKPFWRWSAATGLLLASGAFVALRASPWPSAWLIGWIMDKGGVAANRALARHVPDGIESRLDLRYGPGPDERFDLFRPTNAGEKLPTIIWVHGGGFISGNKEAVANWLRILAGQGHATVGVEYSTGRGHAYPEPVEQVNAALAYLAAHADELGVDGERWVLAGDSAGAQIAAQVALLATDADYARRLGIAPTIEARRLRAMVLVSGAFDLARLPSGLVERWLVHTFLWSYSGQHDYRDDPFLMLASINQQVGAGFPPSFVTSGNADGLEPQARALVVRLDALGVPTDSLFFPADHRPALAHEYQFDLDSPDGQESLERMLAFVRRHTGN